MLKVCGERSVASPPCPAIGIKPHLGAAGSCHGFKGENHPCADDHPVAAFPVIRNVRILVEIPPHAVPDKIPDSVRVYYGDVQLSDTGSLLLGTSRSIGIVGIGDSLHDAEKFAQEICEKVTGPVRFRQDVGTVESIQKRVDLMQKLRRPF